MLPLGTMSISVACAATLMVCAIAKGRVCSHGPTEAAGCVDFQGSCYHQRPCVCLWSMLLPESALMSIGQTAAGDIFMSVTPVAPEAMLMSWSMLLQRTRMVFMACAAAEGRVYVLGLYCHQRPC